MKQYLDPLLLERDPERIASMFSQVAPRYDLLNHVLSAGLDRSWRRTAVRSARPEEAKRILDLATGTGDLAFEFARAAGFRGEVLGLDLSPEMIRLAREKAAAKGLAGRVSFREGDALRVPEPDAAFDVVSAGFGVRNFADPEKGLREAYRLLAGGGRLVVVEFFRRKETPVLSAYLDHALPRIGSWISRSPSAYTYLRHSTKGFLTPSEFVDLLSSVGFAPVVPTRLTWGIAHCIVATKPAAAPAG
ncbi:MAG: bifunctional demethylmenaquinone methyltransferase/2-methoxy-6-polyprenyl-1,4-benzoquinol methylase UbiE [Candidatus Eiseniibacteriota bacterium]